MERRDIFVTPEAVLLSVDAAGLGSRMIAVMIDTAIQAGLLLTILLIVAGVGGSSSTGALVILSIGAFVIVWAYYPLFEGLWSGRTPGKRAQGLRVVRSDGQPATIGPVLVRNIVRVADFLPAFYAVGVASMLLSRRSQRLGDIAAGTLVIRERSHPEPAPLVLPIDPSSRVDTAAVLQPEYVVIRNFLQRRAQLHPQARAQIAAQLSDAIRPRVSGGPSDDEAFLESIAASFREPGVAEPPPTLPPSPAGPGEENSRTPPG